MFSLGALELSNDLHGIAVLRLRSLRFTVSCTTDFCVEKISLSWSAGLSLLLVLALHLNLLGELWGNLTSRSIHLIMTSTISDAISSIGCPRWPTWLVLAHSNGCSIVS